MKLTPLHIAALNGSYEVVVELLKNGADINAESTKKVVRPIQCAIHSGSKKMVRLLMKNGAKFELYCIWHDEDVEMTIAEKVVCFAPAHGKIKVLKMLLDNGTQLKDHFLVQITAANGFEDVLKLFIKNGVDVSLPISEYQIPLFEAVFNRDSWKMVLILNLIVVQLRKIKLAKVPFKLQLNKMIFFQLGI